VLQGLGYTDDEAAELVAAKLVAAAQVTTT
jgi:hypothetical protein